MLAGNDYIHESFDEFNIPPVPTAGFNCNRLGYDGENGVSTFSRLFHPFLSILAGNNDMYEGLDEFEFWPNWTTDCGVSCP